MVLAQYCMMAQYWVLAQYSNDRMDTFVNSQTYPSVTRKRDG